jgi:SAM-dependent methyltransferase
LEWMTSSIASEKALSTKYFVEFVQAAAELGFNIETTPSVMYSDAACRLPKPKQVCFSYHSHGEEDRVWRIKEGYLPGLYTFDRLGYSGFSELARFPDRFGDEIRSFDLDQADKTISLAKSKFFDAGLSKYSQPKSVSSKLPRKYVFFPLQTVHDTVQQFSRIRQADAIRVLAEGSKSSGVALVIKRHPFCQEAETGRALEHAMHSARTVRVVEGPIRELIAGSQSVVGANSGVLFEALIAGKIVHSFATSDFSVATEQIEGIDDLNNVFSYDSTADVSPEVRRFLGWYLSSYCFDIHDRASVTRKILQGCEEYDLLANNRTSYALMRKKHSAKAELARRELILKGSQKKAMSIYSDDLVLNMVRDAYNALASAKTEVWETNQTSPTLPAVVRSTPDQAYYEKLHAEELGYRENNWLVQYLPVIISPPARSLLEIGCGNKKFLAAASSYFEEVIGVDWVSTEVLPPQFTNVRFEQVDIIHQDLPIADIACSADVLEHISPTEIEPLLRKIARSAKYQFHVVACYDDGHSHLSVFDPGTWLALMRRNMGEVWIYDIVPRHLDSTKLVCAITNLPYELLKNIKTRQSKEDRETA